MPSELLNIEPGELQFPFELKKQISCSLRLVNDTDNYVAFKVKTTSPKKYCVRPNTGVVIPQSSSDVTVTMQAQREAPPDMQSKDKFLVQSIIVPYGSFAKDVSQDLFNKENGKDIHEAKLRVVYTAAPQPPSPVPESAEEGISPKASGLATNGDWGLFSSDASPKDVSELKAKLIETRAALKTLTEERNAAVQLSQRLQQEMKNAGINAATINGTTQTSIKGPGFSLFFVFLVSLLGILIGYFMKF